jgi:hypothetical protein
MKWRRERISTRSGAKTSFFTISTGELFVATPQRRDEAAEIRMFQTLP